MADNRRWPEAADGLPISDEALLLHAYGADMETARFVARMLKQNGYALGTEEDILNAAIDRMGWPQIQAFQAELRRGQDIREDAGGFILRAIKRLFGLPPVPSVQTYQDAARAMIAGQPVVRS